MRATLIGHYPPPYGGVATLMRQMEDALTESGWGVSVFNLGHGNPNGENVRNFYAPNRMREVLALWWAFARSRSDIHHYLSSSHRSFWMGATCLFLSWITGCRMVVSFVGGSFPEFIDELSPFQRWVARRALIMASALIPCNQEMEDCLRAFETGVPIKLITNSFPVCGGQESLLPEDIQSFIDGHSPIIASTGGASLRYGLDVAAKGLDLVRRAHPDVGYVLVMTRFGEPEYEPIYESLIESLGLRENVLIVRGIPSFEALLERSDVFLRSSRIDGDSMSVREALALGVPTVASRTAFRPENVLLYEIESPKQMAERIREAFAIGRRDPAEAEAEARKNLEALLDVYSEVAGTDARGG